MLMGVRAFLLFLRRCCLHGVEIGMGVFFTKHCRLMMQLLLGLWLLLLLLFCVVMRLMLHFIVIVNMHILLLLLLLGLLWLLNWNVGVGLRVEQIHSLVLLLSILLVLLLLPLIRRLLVLLHDHLLILGRCRSFHIVVRGLWLLLYHSHMIRLRATARCCRHIYLLVLTLRSTSMWNDSDLIHALICLIGRLV